MLGFIPEWAIGVCVIFAFTAILVRLLPSGRRRPLLPGAPSPDDVASRPDLEDVQRRLAEVEERLDFAERLLAKRDVERVPPPRS
jgi:hypothetical protein